MRSTERLELFKYPLYIPQVVHQVRQNDKVERLLEFGKVVSVCMDEFKLRIMFLCPADHIFGEIDPHSAGGLQRGEQMTLSAAYLEDFLIRADVKTIDLLQAAVIPVAQALPGIQFAGNGVPMGNAGLLIGVGGGVKKRNRLHRCLILRGEGWIEKVAYSSAPMLY
jgi:hypothetical protein